MKKQSLITILLTVLMSMTWTKLFAHDIEVKNANGKTIYYVWTKNNTELAVSYRGSKYNTYADEYTGNVVIPKSVVYNGNTYPVTSIDYRAFSGCSGLNSVTIPNSVTSIGSSAFEGCSGLNSVTIPNSVTSIGSSAFEGCSGLTSVTIPNSVTSIGYSAFENCSGLTSVIIPSSVTSIGSSAFSGCISLTSVTIPNSVTTIGGSAFSGCSGLISVTIPSSVTSIGSDAFSGTPWFNNQPNGLIYAGKVAYTYKGDMPENTSIIIEDGTVEITDNAFSGCSGLTSVTIPNSVTTIGGSAFYKCGSLTSVNISDLAAWCNIKIGSGTGNPLYYAHHLYLNGNEITDLIIPKDVTYISSNAFSYCSSLTSVTIPNSVTSIGEFAFYNCSSLTSVTIPSSVTSIGRSAFTGTSWLTNQPNVLVYAGKVAYKYMGGPDNTSIIIEDGTLGIAASAFNKCRFLTSVTIPSSVTSIGSSAFYDCGLTSVTIPNGVTSIGSNAFEACSSLTSVTIPNSVTIIGIGAFVDCDALTSIVSEIENPYQIDKYVFSSVIFSKAQLIVPVGKKTVYQSTAGWDKFTNIVEAGEIGQVFQIDGIYYKIENNNTVSVTTGNTKCIGDVVIPDQISFFGTLYTVTSIGSSAFYNCSGLTSVTIPNSVTSIGSKAFRNCSNLVSAIIGSGVTSIGSNAFYNTNLKKTIWLTNTLPSGYSTASGAINYVSNDQLNISNKVVYKFLSSYFEVDGVRYVPVSPSDRTCDAIDCTYDTSAKNIIIGETVTKDKITLTVMKVNPYTCYGNTYIKDAKLSFEGSIGDYAFCSCSAMEKAELGQNVTAIGGYAFSECSKLKSIVIPDAVSSLGSYAFQKCTAMTSAKIGNGFETINEYAFSNCSSLKVLKIGSGVKTINNYAFSGCSSLSTITIPKAVTKIDNYVFYNCTSLAIINITDSESTLTLGSNGSSPIFSSCPLDYVYIGRDISYYTSSSYGYSPFYRNTSLRAVKITNKETEISENEFYGCTNLQKVIIGDGVTTIGNWAFSGCQSLKYFAFGTQVANIGQNAFSDCTVLIEISSKATTPPECGSQALDDINKWVCKLFVPDGCIDAYQKAEQWKEFFYIDEGEGTIVIDDEQAVLLGDANNDGEVDAYDIDAIVDYIMSGDINSINFKNADVNKDGSVNAADIVVLNSKIMY